MFVKVIAVETFTFLGDSRRCFHMGYADYSTDKC